MNSAQGHEVFHGKGAVMQTLEQRRVLITRGSRGLGLGVVEAFVARRANVIVIARDSARLTEIKARLGSRSFPAMPPIRCSMNACFARCAYRCSCSTRAQHRRW